MIKKARVNWVTAYKLEGKTDNGLTVHMDTGKGADAASPAQLVLQALAGCTMMDCYLIFSKAKKNIKKFWIDVEADEAEVQPRVFKSIHLTYNITSDNITEADAERAIKLSEEKYCRVHAMIRGNVKLSSSYKIYKEG